MKTSHGLIITSLIVLLTACATQCPTPKNPKTVALYQDENSPHAPYRVIGVASVSRHNLFGATRSDDAMQAMMKQTAANMGGDGLIPVSDNADNLKANVIAYQKILI